MGGMVLGLALLPVVAGCNRPSSDNIQLWKTTQQGPEQLHDTVNDKGVAPRLRGEAAVALVDIGRAEDVDQAFGAMSADDRAEISKTVVPAYEVAMKDPGAREGARLPRRAVLAAPVSATRTSRSGSTTR